MTARLLLLAALAALPFPALAGPPFLTDDPDPIDYQTYEAIPAYSVDRTPGGNTIGAPVMDFNDGIWPEMHLNIQPGLVHLLPAQGASAYGAGDTRVALKWRFKQETDSSPEIAIYPAVELPTGSASRGLGNGQAWYQFPLWLEKNWGPWSSYGGGGWTLNRAPGQRDYFYGGWEVQHQLSDAWFLGGEIYAQGASGVGVGGFTAANLGGGYAFSKRVSLIFSAGHSFAGASQALAYLGLDCTW